MKELFNTIVERLKSEVDGLSFIDFDLGQLDVLYDNVRPVVNFPCCLIDIEYSCEDNDLSGQLITARVTLKLAFEQQLPTDSAASQPRRNAALKVFDTIQQVHEAVQGYSTDQFSAFSRKSLTPDRRFAGIRVFDIVYETTFQE